MGIYNYILWCSPFEATEKPWEKRKKLTGQKKMNNAIKRKEKKKCVYV
jgi:hypothetical protein